jgi:hypothetical protein
MKLPAMRTGIPSTASPRGGWTAGSGARAAVVPQGCSGWKKLACGGAFVACGASCVLGPEICVPCLAAVGATDCLSCLLDW